MSTSIPSSRFSSLMPNPDKEGVKEVWLFFHLKYQMKLFSQILSKSG